MYSAIANRALVSVANTCWWYTSSFRVAKNGSAAALSHHYLANRLGDSVSAQ